MSLLACQVTEGSDVARMAELACELQVPLLAPAAVTRDYTYTLLFQDGMLQLQPSDRKLGGPLYVDFHSAAQEYRRHTSGIRQDIARAAGCKPGVRPSILDATAGLGGDAFVLASLGCQVILLESHPVVYALLEDGIRRACQSDADAAAIVRDCICLLPRQDAIDYLQSTPPVDVVYLDPMFPERQKTAKVKKAMQYFHDIVGINPQQEKVLLDLALQVAAKRVVVKRPRQAPLLAGLEPSYQVTGKSVRYDVYLTGSRT